jgi:hypothetical protein
MLLEYLLPPYIVERCRGPLGISGTIHALQNEGVTDADKIYYAQQADILISLSQQNPDLLYI